MPSEGTIGVIPVAASGASRRGHAPLVKKRENRENEYTPLIEDVEDGDLVVCPVRSGGAFDPLGCRSVDVMRAEDVYAIAKGHPGRWIMVTLTIDRSGWLGPDEFAIPIAYQRCNERVREVTRRISTMGIHVTALELQSKTGGGWPHWHLIVWAENDDRTIEQLWIEVERAWVLKRLDLETGEITSERTLIGRVDVQEARSNEGVCKYASKYVTKSWPSIPAWMGEGNRQLRKLRISARCFDWLEREGRHVRSHTPRRKPNKYTKHRRPACTLYERMARSGSEHVVCRRVGDQLKYVETIPLPANYAGWSLMSEVGGRAIRLGKPSSMRYTLTDEDLSRLYAKRWKMRAIQREYIWRGRCQVESSWDEEQARRRRSNDVDLVERWT